MRRESYSPLARVEGLMVEPLGEELLVFDLERNRPHSLNSTAALVWQACDGQRDVHALTADCQLDPDTVELALDRLRSSHLLSEEARVSRGTMLRRTAIAGVGVGAAIPVIRSIVAPTPAMAITVTCSPGGGPCTGNGQCCTDSSNSFCNGSGKCASVCYAAGSPCGNTASCCFGTACTPHSGSSSSCQRL